MLPKPLAALIVLVSIVIAGVWVYNSHVNAIYDSEFQSSSGHLIRNGNRRTPTVGDEMFQNVTKPILLCVGGIALVWAIVSLASQSKPAPYRP